MSMQKIKNYGSFLQAYALKKMIEKLGADVEFIDYHVEKTLITSEKKQNAIHVVYALKNENYRANKWKQILDLNCTYTDTKDTAQFNKINEWLASQYRRLDADMDTITKTSNSRIYETILHDKKTHIIGYIFPAANGFCIAQYMQKTKMTETIKTNLVKNIKKINVRKF